MTKLTENEQKLLDYITVASSFNGDTLDFSKSFEEQCLEDEDMYQTFVEIKDYNKLLGTNNAGSRAVLGSLVKKKLLSIYQDEDYPENFWVHIYKEHFDAIKDVLNKKETTKMNAQELQEKVVTALKSLEENDRNNLMQVLARKQVDYTKMNVSLLTTKKDINSVLRNGNLALFIAEGQFELYGQKWNCLARTKGCNKPIETYISVEGVFGIITQNIVVDKQVEIASYEPSEQEVSGMQQLIKQTYIDKKVYEVASAVTKLDEKTKALIEQSVQQACKQGKVLNGKDVPTIDLDDYANNVARLMRHLQTKSLNKEERETQINKDYLIDKYSRELAIELVKVDKIVKEVHARCQALVA